MNISISLWPKADKRFPKFSKQSSWCGKADTIHAVPEWQLSSTWRGAQSLRRHPADLWRSRHSAFQAESHRSKRQTERDRLVDVPCLHWTPPQWTKDSAATTVFLLGCSLLVESQSKALWILKDTEGKYFLPTLREMLLLKMNGQ